MIDTTLFAEVKKRVGVFHKQNRNWYRNITRHDHEDFELKTFYDWCRLANAVRRRVGLEAKERFKYTRMPPSYPPVDLYHHWRTVDFGSAPWVVSTSAGLPFGWSGRAYREGLKLLASKACKRILVTGRCAREWQRSKAEEEPDLEHEIMRKVEVLPPAQERLVPNWENKPIDLDGPLRLTFVGGTFFRKGGWELLQAVRQLRSEGANVRLDVVSSLGRWHQMTDEEQDPDEARRLMEETDAITWHGRLPNSEVLELFRRSHIGLLPSYIETYGYTVLEAQAAGCPTITTDIKAFPDTNPDEVGWRIGIDGDDYDFRSREGRARISERIERGLYRTLKTILGDRSAIRKKGIAALERIAEEHAPVRHGKRLREIYWEALNN